MKKAWGRKLIQFIAPAPGDGPREQVINDGFMKLALQNIRHDGSYEQLTIRAQGDPGNRITVQASLYSDSVTWITLCADRELFI